MQEQPEPLHPSAKKFLEVVLQDFTFNGSSRRLEFIDEPDGTTTLKLIFPSLDPRLAAKDTIIVGIPQDWWPPPDEEWDEQLRKEVLGEE